MATRARIWDLVLIRHFRCDEVERMAAHIDVRYRLLDSRHVARHALVAGTVRRVMRVCFDTRSMRAIWRRSTMAVQADLASGLDQVGVVRSAVHIVTAEASHTAPVHETLNKIISLHPVLVPCAIRKMRETGLAQLVLLELPVVFQIQALMKTDGPIVIQSFNRIRQRLSL